LSGELEQAETLNFKYRIIAYCGVVGQNWTIKESLTLLVEKNFTTFHFSSHESY
jgi:hypothetical protein